MLFTVTTTTTLMPLLGGLLALAPAANAAAVTFNPRASNQTEVNRSGIIDFFADASCSFFVHEYDISSPNTYNLFDGVGFYLRYLPIDAQSSFCNIDLFVPPCADIGDPDISFFLPAIDSLCTPLSKLYQCIRMNCFLEGGGF